MKLINKVTDLPDSKFKTQISEFGLVKKKKLKKLI